MLAIKIHNLITYEESKQITEMLTSIDSGGRFGVGDTLCQRILDVYCQQQSFSIPGLTKLLGRSGYAIQRRINVMARFSLLENVDGHYHITSKGKEYLWRIGKAS